MKDHSDWKVAYRVNKSGVYSGEIRVVRVSKWRFTVLLRELKMYKKL